MTCLRITNIYSVQINGYLIAGSAAHADISLCAHIATLSHVHTSDEFQDIVHAHHRQ